MKPSSSEQQDWYINRSLVLLKSDSNFVTHYGLVGDKVWHYPKGQSDETITGDGISYHLDPASLTRLPTFI